MKKKVIVTLGAEAAPLLRIEAGCRDLSVSEYLADRIEREKQRRERDDLARARSLPPGPGQHGPVGSPLPTRVQVEER